MALKSEFDTCESRVNSRQKTEENCAQELLDFVGCVDKCVSVSCISKFVLEFLHFLISKFHITIYNYYQSRPNFFMIVYIQGHWPSIGGGGGERIQLCYCILLRGGEIEDAK